MIFLLSKKDWIGQFSASHHYILHPKWLQILDKTTRELKETLKKQQRNLGPKSHMCPFLTYPYFWEGFCFPVMILEKVANFGTLEEVVFGKPPGCTLKLCNRLPAWLFLKREIKVLLLRFWWVIFLKLWFFVEKWVILAPIQLINR